MEGIESKYVKTKEAYTYLKISRTTFFKLIKSGKIKPRTMDKKNPASKRGPGLWFLKSDLDKILK